MSVCVCVDWETWCHAEAQTERKKTSPLLYSKPGASALAEAALPRQPKTPSGGGDAGIFPARVF